MLSTGQVLKILAEHGKKVTKQTLYKWIMTNKIKVIAHEIGGRTFLEFDPDEIKKLLSRLKTNKEREKGRTLFK